MADQLSDGNKKNGEADIVILLVHEGAATTDVKSAVDPKSRFGKIVLGADKNIDAIVSGHTHLAYNHVINGRPVISSGQYGERFSRMDIQYSKSTKTVTMKNEIFNLMDGTVPLYPDDPAVAPIVAAAKAQADTLGDVVLGSTTAALGRAVFADPVAGKPIDENRGGESTLGNFVADVQRWSLNADGPKNVDVVFMNPGGLRADIDAGPVTYREAANVQPFANTLVTLKLTGAQIKTVLEQQWQPTGASRPFLKLGVNKELTYTYDPTAAAGSAHQGDLPERGARSTRARSTASERTRSSHRAATTSSSWRTARRRRTAARSICSPWSTTSRRTPTTRSRPTSRSARSVCACLGTGRRRLRRGDQVTVTLSSLDFTRDEPLAGTVTVSYGTTPLEDRMPWPMPTRSTSTRSERPPCSSRSPRASAA